LNKHSFVKASFIMSTYDYKNQAMQHEYSDCFLDAVYTVHI